jgi:hypothetical protein
VKRLILGLLLSGCATSYRTAVTGPTAFSFQLEPLQCAELMKERRGYRAVEQASIFTGGAGALAATLFLGLLDAKAAPAAAAGVALAAGGVGAFSGSQVSSLDEELAAGGCAR